ncbi:hypothetical protein GDO86_017244, partial [Hymenochirus boettgeri]
AMNRQEIGFLPQYSASQSTSQTPGEPTTISGLQDDPATSLKTTPQSSGSYFAFAPPPPYTEQVESSVQVGPTTTIIVRQSLTDLPGQTVCQSCNQPCITKIRYNSGCLTTLLCCLLFFFGCVLGCCLIPCCIDSCKDVDHFCPNCHHHIYKYKRL